MRRLASLALALGVTLAFAGGAAGTKSSTTVRRFIAFNGKSLAPTLEVTKRGRGYCWVGSIADGRTDAWRCFLGNSILDPCFSKGKLSKPFVVCPIAPWSRRATVLVLTKPIPLVEGNATSRSSTEPWGIVTANGKHCLAFTGATGVIGGRYVRYGCQEGGVLLGVPDRHTPVWTIFYAAKNSSLQFRVRITDAWS
jgi:hypothetical protein